MVVRLGSGDFAPEKSNKNDGDRAGLTAE